MDKEASVLIQKLQKEGDSVTYKVNVYTCMADYDYGIPSILDDSFYTSFRHD